VSEETFGQMTDGNIGQTLQYLPSISMNEDQDGSVGGINIRGVENEYNAFLIVRRSGRYSSEQISRSLFPKKPPAPKSLDELKEGIRRRARERYARR
jgi:hypothetical protein